MNMQQFTTKFETLCFFFIVFPPLFISVWREHAARCQEEPKHSLKSVVGPQWPRIHPLTMSCLMSVTLPPGVKVPLFWGQALGITL